MQRIFFHNWWWLVLLLCVLWRLDTFKWRECIFVCHNVIWWGYFRPRLCHSSATNNGHWCRCLYLYMIYTYFQSDLKMKYVQIEFWLSFRDNKKVKWICHIALHSVSQLNGFLAWDYWQLLHAFTSASMNRMTQIHLKCAIAPTKYTTTRTLRSILPNWTDQFSNEMLNL